MLIMGGNEKVRLKGEPEDTQDWKYLRHSTAFAANLSERRLKQCLKRFLSSLNEKQM